MDSRSGRIFSQIDVDGSGSVTKSEVIQMMVLGGAASESQAYSEANRLFDQGLITGKTMTERQFTQLFQAELVRLKFALTVTQPLCGLVH
jgi:Ca2+-binding EF-hand superfamily protein